MPAARAPWLSLRVGEGRWRIHRGVWCGGGDSIFQAAGGGGGGTSLANNPQLVDYNSGLPTIRGYSSDTPAGGAPRVTLSYDDAHIPVAHPTSPTTGEQVGATPHFAGHAEHGVDIAAGVDISVYSDSSNTLVQDVDRLTVRSGLTLPAHCPTAPTPPSSPRHASGAGTRESAR